MSKRVDVSGNTYPVKDELKALGGRWDAKRKVWTVPADKEEEAKAIVAKGPSSSSSSSISRRSYSRCQVCGIAASRYCRIYGSGECRDCYEERKMGY